MSKASIVRRSERGGISNCSICTEYLCVVGVICHMDRRYRRSETGLSKTPTETATETAVEQANAMLGFDRDIRALRTRHW